MNETSFIEQEDDYCWPKEEHGIFKYACVMFIATPIALLGFFLNILLTAVFWKFRKTSKLYLFVLAIFDICSCTVYLFSNTVRAFSAYHQIYSLHRFWHYAYASFFHGFTQIVNGILSAILFWVVLDCWVRAKHSARLRFIISPIFRHTIILLVILFTIFSRLPYFVHVDVVHHPKCPQFQDLALGPNPIYEKHYQRIIDWNEIVNEILTTISAYFGTLIFGIVLWTVARRKFPRSSKDYVLKQFDEPEPTEITFNNNEENDQETYTWTLIFVVVMHVVLLFFFVIIWFYQLIFQADYHETLEIIEQLDLHFSTHGTFTYLITEVPLLGRLFDSSLRFFVYLKFSPTIRRRIKILLCRHREPESSPPRYEFESGRRLLK
ncbi:unnamed protein product, partial [Mesorhabditis belari]|uniref:G-protein coupled receptors family 1 profile domain-containing protein n=1 Tax=Mesorhabditis belari TaxID=2138241 RepID=A0AAF3J7E7_9BILA